MAKEISWERREKERGEGGCCCLALRTLLQGVDLCLPCGECVETNLLSENSQRQSVRYKSILLQTHCKVMTKARAKKLCDFQRVCTPAGHLRKREKEREGGGKEEGNIEAFEHLRFIDCQVQVGYLSLAIDSGNKVAKFAGQTNKPQS